MAKHLITGVAGFIGSTLADRLLKEGHYVVGVDNFSTGKREFLESARQYKTFELYERDLLKQGVLDLVLQAGTDTVFHLAANADVRDGLSHPGRDLEQNTLVTWNVLESIRKAKVPNIVFSSTGSIYGEAPLIPTPENCPFPVQTSLYGASKLAGEGLISAYAEGYGLNAFIFRFVSIMGERYTHGHVFDFIKQLIADPTRLKVLGDGKQRKSYLYVQDCISAILHAMKIGSTGKTAVYNLGTPEYVNVDESIRIICQEMGVEPRIEHTGGDRGWVGDNPFIFLDTKKIQETGWAASLTIKQCVQKTAQYLLENRWLFDQVTTHPEVKGDIK